LTPTRPLHFQLELQSVFTAIHACETLSLGVLDVDAVLRLKRNNYDNAPVWDGQHWIGMVETKEAFRLCRESKPLETNNAKLWKASLSTPCALADLLSVLGQHRAVLVNDRDGQTVLGMVTISDLNRHPVRVALYDLFGALETNLARLLERAHTEPWNWIDLLPATDRLKVVAAWEEAKKKNVDVGPIVTLFLPQLLDLICKTDALRQDLGFKTEGAMKPVNKSIVDHRNAIMHPVKYLVLDLNDAKKLLSAVQAVMLMNEKAAEMLS
jgi:hypothetical protein